MNRFKLSRRALSIASVVLALVVLLGWVALRSGPMAPVPVTVVRVESRALQPSLFGVGTVEARQVHRIGPTAPGRVQRLNVDVGDTVHAGQLLGEMDPIDSDDRLRSQQALIQRASATVAEAEARHTHAQAQARRYEQLFAQQVVTQELLAARLQDLQVAQAAHTAARNELARAQSDAQALRTQRHNLRLISPVDGIVTLREVEPGTTVVAGQAVIEIVDPRSLWVHARFDQVSAAGLRDKLPAQVVLRSRRAQPVAGQVLRTELRADAITEELLAKVVFQAVPQPLPPIGERAEVTVNLPALPEGPVIPNAAVQRQGNRIGVWTLHGDQLSFVPVKLGRSDLDGHVQVTDGLRSGDAIVLHSARPLAAGTHVQVVDRIPGVAT
jgi:RND family efflux transporter MFP subunit